MDLHGVKKGYHKRGTQKNLYDLVEENEKILTF
jgi:hypothetical protein